MKIVKTDELLSYLAKMYDSFRYEDSLTAFNTCNVVTIIMGAVNIMSVESEDYDLVPKEVYCALKKLP